MFSKHKLDAARIDFHNSFPPTRRSKTCERIEFPSGEYRSTIKYHASLKSPNSCVLRRMLQTQLHPVGFQGSHVYLVTTGKPSTEIAMRPLE